MATTEKKGILTYVDESNNMTLLYPVTTVDAIDGLDEVISDVYDEIEKETGKVKATADAALPKTGGTMTGNVTVLTPTADMHPATKQYVDGKRKTFTATITTNDWSSAAPYTQTIGISDILATDMPHISPVYSDTLDTALAQKEAWSLVSKAVTANGSITFTCLEEKPVTAIPIQVEVIR